MEKPPKTIYLIPDNEHGYVWCDSPDPGVGMDSKDAVKYVRADLMPEERHVAVNNITVPMKISSCRECPNVTNSSREHDDPFSDAPLDVSWWCCHKESAVDYVNPDKINSRCPYKIQDQS